MSDLMEHFDNTDAYNKVICKLCNKTLSSARSFNLKAHLKNVHEIEINTNKNNSNKNENKSKLIKTKLEINKLEIIRSYIGLVTENGLPFDILNSQNMRNIMQPISNALSIGGEKMFNFNAENAKKVLSEVVIKLRALIKKELENTLFSIKIDTATRLDRNIFGISVQYGIEGKIVSRIIGMVELKGISCSTSKNLASEILKSLNKYDLNIQQVIAITSDNGANMLKTTSLLSHCITNYQDEEEYLSNDDYAQVLDEIDGDTDLNIGEITICRCAAHTAQLVAVDVIKMENIKAFILQCRNVTKFLRKPRNGFRTRFENNKLHIPQMDCPTRWGSTFRMIKDLKSSKTILDNSEITLSSTDDCFEIDEKFWEYVDAFLLVFGPLNEILVKFQEESLNYSDFYAKWVTCKLLIQNILNESAEDSFAKTLGNSLIKSIEKRSEKLLSNDILKSCLYLDPRFQHTLTAKEKETAVAFLKKTWDKFILLNKEYATNFNQSGLEPEINDEEDILTAFLKQDYMEENPVVTNIYTKLESLKLKFLKGTTCVVNYWRDRRSTDPELFILSNILLSVPPTQVTIERAFSALRTILTETRNRLSHENLENILLAKLNPNLLDDAIAENFKN